MKRATIGKIARKAYSYAIATIPISIGLFAATSAFAQIVPDSTTGTRVTPNLVIKGIPSDRIDAGTLRGTNLFHSFTEFNVGSDRGVYFSNPAGVTDIFARVTGGNPSNIFGRLGILGDASLFLLNPNGVVFGPNASLDLNGSLYVTSANSVRFADGTTFSAVNPESSPLLTSSIPIGLGFGTDPGRIEVQGLGNQFTAQSIFSQIDKSNSPPGLEMQPGQTIALIGGDILLDGGILTAPSGRIELGSVQEGFVGWTPASLDYNAINTFGTIEMKSAAALDASGTGGGSIRLQAGNMYLGASDMLIQNSGDRPAGNIVLNATDNIDGGNIRNEALGPGAGGSVFVSAKQLTLQNGAGFSTRSYSTAAGGNINLNVSDSILIDGIIAVNMPSNGVVTSTINSLAFGSGNAGNLSIATKQLQVLNGGIISTTTAGTGKGGQVNIQADSIDLVGFEPTFLIPSAITSSTFGLGNAGDVTISTRQLSVQDGGRVDASTVAIGAAGSVTINASEQVTVSGTVPNSRNPSLIISSANAIDPSLAGLVGITLPLQGNSGDVTINTPKLEVTNGAKVSVSNDGTGRSGSLSINANDISLTDSGSITAASVSGGGGNIFLQARDALQLQRGGQITATAGSTGNSGNISIDAGIITGLDNSQITANAFQGNGGNIRINAQGLFFSSDSSITAGSELGVSGIVSISNLDLTAKNVFVLPSANFVKVDALVSNSCLAKRNVAQGSFVVTGSGGLPDNPYNRFVGDFPATSIQPVPNLQVQKLRDRDVEVPKQTRDRSPTSNWQLGDPIVEVKGLTRTNDGRILPVITYDDASALLCSTARVKNP